MKRLLVLLLAACALLYACGAQPSLFHREDPGETTPPTTAPTVPGETTGPTEPPEAAYRHPLTGAPLDAPFAGRCTAVVINNIRQAQPLYGIGQADVLYEIIAEGGGSITRCLGIFSEIGSVEKIGSIRSARTYLVDLARAHRAVLVHCGGSDYSLDELEELRYDAVNEYYNGKYFYRDEARLAAGYAWEHTLFASGQELLACMEKKQFSMEGEYDPAFLPAFAEDSPIRGEPAASIEVRFNPNGKATVMTYDPDSGCYYGEQRWRNGDEYSYTSPLADGETPVGYRNVLVLYVKTTTDGYRMFTDQSGAGEGYYACGGQIVPIRWHRESLDEPFTYTLTDGTPLTWSVGRTYAAVLPLGSPTVYS